MIKTFRDEIRIIGIRQQVSAHVEAETWNAIDAMRVPMSLDRFLIARGVREGIKKALP